MLISTSKIVISKGTSADALEAWNNSLDATVFHHPEVLSVLAPSVEWWFATVGREVICAWPVTQDAQGKCIAPTFSSYVGPFFSDRVRSASSRGRLLAEVAACRTMIPLMAKEYGRVQFSLPPTVNDLRPYLWSVEQYNGGDCNVALTVLPRYTAVIERLQERDDAELLRCFGQTRRNAVRRAAGEGNRQVHGDIGNDVWRLYEETLQGSGAGHLAAARRASFERLLTLVGRGFARILRWARPDSALTGAVWVLLVVRGRAYNVIAAAPGEWRQRNAAAWCTLESLHCARASGAQEYDFCGANTLARATDKHSYGANTRPYFDLSIEWKVTP